MAFDQIDEEKLKERVIHINRVAKVVKGAVFALFGVLAAVVSPAQEHAVTSDEHARRAGIGRAIAARGFAVGRAL